MERSRLLQCLAADYLRLRTVAATRLTAPVPSCPGWTAADLVRHVGEVYLHKATVMRLSAWPDPWPAESTAAEEPIALLDRGYGELTDQFSRRGDADHALTWHKPDQTVKFWIRRMAQESVIHRIDAELALHTDIAPIPEDLAVDGVDEVLRLFVGYGSRVWQDEFAPLLSGVQGRTVRVQLDGGGAPGSAAAAGPSWLIRAEPGGVTVSSPETAAVAAASSADAVVSGPAVAVLRWLWARESAPTADAPAAARVQGDEEAITEFRRLLVAGTQ
jgi:hypothetical protein